MVKKMLFLIVCFAIFTVILRTKTENKKTFKIPLFKSKKTHYFYPGSFYITTPKGIYIFNFNKKENNLELIKFYRHSGIKGTYYDKDGIYIFENAKIIKLNYQLEEEIAVTTPHIAAFAGNQDAIFISSQGNFISFDKNLKKIAKLPLKCGEYLKDSHDILIYKDKAYLLDNVIFPIFTFRVNIADFRNPFIESQISISELNPHLKAQWLNPYLNQWGILIDYTVYGGNGQNICLYPMESGKEKISEKNIYFNDYLNKDIEGIKILDIVKLPPIWGVGIKDKKIALFLLKTENNSVNYLSFLLKNIEVDENYKLKKWLRNYALLYNTNRNIVYFFSIANQRIKLLKEFDFQKYKLGGILDIQVIR